jgi:Flp pilus assembly protein TadD
MPAAPPLSDALARTFAEAVAAHGRGVLPEAARGYRTLLAERPDLAPVHSNLGALLQTQGLLSAAQAHYRAAIALMPEYAKAYANLGIACQALSHAPEAVVHLRRATRLARSDADTWASLGVALAEAGDLAQAADAYTTAAALAPFRPRPLRLLSCLGRLPNDLRHRLETLAERADTLPVDDRVELHFALARVLADAGQPGKAFSHLLDGNRLKRQGLTYDEPATLASFDRIRRVFDSLPPRAETGTAQPGPRPVFVVGMPRSGTSLVEQILASHPLAFGGGERSDLKELADALAVNGRVFPEVVQTLSRQDLAILGARYRDRLRTLAPDARVVIDKMPGNLKLVGLIRLALPDARIVQVRRDGLDTCLSCFAELFEGTLPFAYDLAELGRYCRASQALMDHWRQLIPADVLMDLVYEDLVGDFEVQARRLLAHCGLPWDDRCRDFHQTRRTVRTASAAQVRQPLYRHGVGRWRAFAPFAQPLLAALTGPDPQC